MTTKDQVREYIESKKLTDLAEAFFEGFFKESGDPFDTKIVQEEEEYHKKDTRFVYQTHNVVGTEIYFTAVSLASYYDGQEIESWYFVEPVTITKTIYKVVK